MNEAFHSTVRQLHPLLPASGCASMVVAAPMQVRTALPAIARGDVAQEGY